MHRFAGTRSTGTFVLCRDLYLRIAGARGHQQTIRAPQSIADQLQWWFEEEGADGFSIMASWLSDGLSEFAELVVPEPQRRGLFRTEYEGWAVNRHALRGTQTPQVVSAR